MGSKIKKVLAVWFLCVSLILSTAVLGHAYSSILSFGDSLSDNGVYGSTNGTTTNTNIYDGFGIGYYTNGPVWVENMASTYGVQLLDMAYGGATTGINDPAVAYATGGAAGVNNLGVQWQVGAYLAAVSSSVSSNTLVTVWAGANDFLDYVVGQNGNTQNLSSANISQVAATAAMNMAMSLTALANAGGQHFLVPFLPDIGTTPAFNGTPLQGIATSYSSIYNAYLLAYLNTLANLFPSAQFSYLDSFGLIDNLINNPDYYASLGYDFTNVTTSGNYNPPAGYLFWDGMHPSAEAQALFAYLAETQAQKVPEPATMLLLGLGLIGLAGVRRKIKK